MSLLVPYLLFVPVKTALRDTAAQSTAIVVVTG